MSKEIGKEPTKLLIWSWKKYERGKITDLWIVTACIPHRRMQHRENGTVYQQQRNLLISMGETIPLLRLYYKELLSQLQEWKARGGGGVYPNVY